MPLRDGQVHHDTHVIPRGNYVIGVGNYLIATPSELGNYEIADTLIGPTPAVTRILQLSGIDQVIPVHARAEEVP